MNRNQPTGLVHLFLAGALVFCSSLPAHAQIIKPAEEPVPNRKPKAIAGETEPAPTKTQLSTRPIRDQKVAPASGEVVILPAAPPIVQPKQSQRVPVTPKRAIPQIVSPKNLSRPLATPSQPLGTRLPDSPRNSSVVLPPPPLKAASIPRAPAQNQYQQQNELQDKLVSKPTVQPTWTKPTPKTALSNYLQPMAPRTVQAPRQQPRMAPPARVEMPTPDSTPLPYARSGSVSLAPAARTALAPTPAARTPEPTPAMRTNQPLAMNMQPTPAGTGIRKVFQAEQSGPASPVVPLGQQANQNSTGLKNGPVKFASMNVAQGSGSRTPMVTPQPVPQGGQILGGNMSQGEIVLPPETGNTKLFSSPGTDGFNTAPGVIPTDGFVDNSMINSAPLMNESVVGGCSSCGDTSCSGGCGGGQGAPGFGGGCYGAVSCARNYFHAEALYYFYDDSSISGANSGGLGDHDGEFGWRATFGRRFDCTAGDELVYWGTAGWENSRRILDPGFRLSANWGIGAPFLPSQVSSFFNAAEQIESRESDLHSLEYNRVRWGWDVVKTHWGIRAIYFDDDYSLFSNDGISTGTFSLDASNFMIGPQIGGELFYDVGYRTSYSFLAKAGGYINFTELETSLVNGGVNILNRDDNDANLSGSVDLGLFAHYQLSPSARFRVGYNLHWLFGTATTTENFPAVINANTGGSVLDEDEVLFHGVSFGLEIFR